MSQTNQPDLEVIDTTGWKTTSLENAPQSSQFISAWARETYANTMKVATDTLNKLLTFSMASLGGSIALLGSMHKVPRAITIFLLLAALIASLIGVLPKSAGINIDCINHNDAWDDYNRGLAIRLRGFATHFSNRL